MSARTLKAAAFTTFAAAAAVAWFIFASKTDDRNVFVNESSDHRYDESIQVSILAARERSKVQNAVVISDRYPLDAFNDAAIELFARLRLGRANAGRSVLYLFSPKLHALKIETGYALESVIPDVSLRFLERAAKTFVFSERYQDFWSELINTINIEIVDRERGLSTGSDFSGFRFLSGGGGIFSRDYEATYERLVEESRAMDAKAPAGRYGASRDVGASIAAYLDSLRDGVGDAKIPVLSDESGAFRRMTPMTSFQLFRNAKFYDEAGLAEVVEAGRFAYAFFRRGRPALPIVLERIDAVWRVQEPLSWSLFQRFENSDDVFLKYPMRLPATAQLAFARRFAKPIYPGPQIDPGAPGDELQALYFRLYALDRIATKLEASPWDAQSDDRLRIAYDVLLNLGRMTESLNVQKTLVKRHPDDRELARTLKFYENKYRFKGASWRLAL